MIARLNKYWLVRARARAVARHSLTSLNDEEVKQEVYKHLGILGREDACQDEIKEIVKKEYLKKVRAVMKSGLRGGNTIRALNTYDVKIDME